MALQQQQLQQRLQMHHVLNNHQLLEAAASQCFKSCVQRVDSGDTLTSYQSACVKTCVDKFLACQQTMQAMLTEMRKQYDSKRG